MNYYCSLNVPLKKICMLYRIHAMRTLSILCLPRCKSRQKQNITTVLTFLLAAPQGWDDTTQRRQTTSETGNLMRHITWTLYRYVCCEANGIFESKIDNPFGIMDAKWLEGLCVCVCAPNIAQQCERRGRERWRRAEEVGANVLDKQSIWRTCNLYYTYKLECHYILLHEHSLYVYTFCLTT